MSIPEHYDEIKTTVLDTRTVKAKQLASDKVSVRGKDIKDIIDESGFKPEDLLSRIKIEDGEYYVLWDDNGQIVKINRPLNSEIMAFNYTSIKEINENLSNVTTLAYRFQGCDKLEKFDHPEITNCWSFDHTFHKCTNLSHFNIGSMKPCKYLNGCFNGTKIKSWDIDLPNCTSVEGTFAECKNFISFKGAMPKVTNMGGFLAFSTVESFISSDTSAVTSIYQAFTGCKNLTTFKTNNLQNVKSAGDAFKEAILLTSFDYDLPSLTYAAGMFQHSGLTSFSKNIDSLTNGSQMFYSCKKLRSFNSKLPSLTNGNYMFEHCPLDKESVINIINTLKNDNQCEDPTNAKISIGIDINLKTDEELLSFLGITSGTNQTISITNPKGINWQVNLTWHNPPSE